MNELLRLIFEAHLNGLVNNFIVPITTILSGGATGIVIKELMAGTVFVISVVNNRIIQFAVNLTVDLIARFFEILLAVLTGLGLAALQAVDLVIPFARMPTNHISFAALLTKTNRITDSKSLLTCMQSFSINTSRKDASPSFL